MTHDPTVLGGAVDLTNCDREPIHLLDNIQPHGALLSLDPEGFSVLQASEGCEALLGAPAQALLGQGLDAVFGEALAAELREALGSLEIKDNPTHLMTTSVRGAAPAHITAHQYEGAVILELEPVGTDGAPDFYVLVKRSLRRFELERSFASFTQAVTEEMRRLTGYDRVIIYKFREDGSGTVIAEDHAAGLESFLDLRYPESDIPRQARALYLKTPVRLIVDARYAPARIVPALSPRSGRPLDLTHATLRGVSPMHLQYLANMGVRASMSLGLTSGDTLWGLIACHHYQGPRRLAPDARAACELIAKLVSLQLTEKEAREHVEYENRIRAAHVTLVEALSGSTQISEALAAAERVVLAFVDCGGAAVVSDGACHLFGETPREDQVRALADWLASTHRDEVFTTDALPSVYPPAAAFKAVASGVLALRFARSGRDYVLWFRPEVIETVHWAGDPKKQVDLDGERLTPRGSFALWKETVRDRATPFQRVEIDAALRLRVAVLDLVYRRNEQLSAINAELSRTNQELDAFAYVASHDLKEPLRGIHNFAGFLLEDYGDKLDDDGKQKLETLVRLTRRMQALIDSLLRLSRVGRSTLMIEPIDLNELLSPLREALSALIAETLATLVVPRPLPVVKGDRARIQEVLENLVSNAIKYNNKPERLVEIGWEPPEASGGAPRIYVKDNGIGIPERHQEVIFRIFKRLHPESRFGGGTGVGLTIAKKLIEMHGGKLWLESVESKGSTFWFTTTPEEAS